MKYSTRVMQAKAVCTCRWSYGPVSDREGVSRMLSAIQGHCRYNGSSEEEGGHVVTKVHQVVTTYKRGPGRPKKDTRKRAGRGDRGNGVGGAESRGERPREG